MDPPSTSPTLAVRQPHWLTITTGFSSNKQDFQATLAQIASSFHSHQINKLTYTWAESLTEK